MLRWVMLCGVLASVMGSSAAWAQSVAKRDNKRWGYPPQLKAASHVAMRQSGDVKLPLFVYLPENHQATDKRAAIVFFFGGGWKAGTPGQFDPQCQYLASRGMVAITADYRVASRHGVKAVDCVHDAKSTIRWVREHAEELGIDPNKVVASGGSAGGHIAACSGTIAGEEADGENLSISSVPNAMALFNPAVMLAPLDGTTLLDPEKVASMKERTGVDPERISPIHHVRKNLPPTIIFHGTNDSAVPFGTVELFTEKTTNAGNRCELVAFEGQPHGFFNYGRGGSAEKQAVESRNYRETMYRLDQFLSSLGYLKGEPSIELPKDRTNVRILGTKEIAR